MVKLVELAWGKLGGSGKYGKINIVFAFTCDTKDFLFHKKMTRRYKDPRADLVVDNVVMKYTLTYISIVRLPPLLPPTYPSHTFHFVNLETASICIIKLICFIAISTS